MFYRVFLSLLSASSLAIAADAAERLKFVPGTFLGSAPSVDPLMPKGEAVSKTLAAIPTDLVRQYTLSLQPLTRETAPRILFVPGILGSRIEECQADDSQCHSIWGTVESLTKDVDLSIRPDRKYRTDVVDSFLFKEVYGGLLDFIRREAIRLGPDEPGDPFLTAFHYDWRRSNVGNAARLAHRVCEIASAAPKASIVVLAHSMGGLVTKIWASRHAAVPCPNNAKPRIAKIVFVATPHLGSPKSLEAFVDGYSLLFDEVKLLNKLVPFWRRWETNYVLKSLNEVGMTFPSVYELLPIKTSKSCREKKPSLASDKIPNPVEGDAGDPIDLFDAKKWREYDLLQRMGPSAFRQPFYQNELPKLLTNAETVLCDLVDFDPGKIAKVQYIIGEEAVDSTDGWIRLRAPPSKIIDATKVQPGDGTVPVYSAENHIVSRTDERSEVRAAHLPIISDETVRDIVRGWYKIASADAKLKLLATNEDYRPLVVAEAAATSDFLPISLDASTWESPEARRTASINADALALAGNPPAAAATAAFNAPNPKQQAELYALAAATTANDVDRLTWMGKMAEAAYTAGSYDAAAATARVVLAAAKGSLPSDSPQIVALETTAQQVLGWSSYRLGNIEGFNAIAVQFKTAGRDLEEPTAGTGLITAEDVLTGKLWATRDYRDLYYLPGRP